MVKLPRRIAAVPTPQHEEWFISWRSRTAASLGIPTATLHWALGIGGHGTGKVRSFWVILDKSSIAAVAQASGFSPEQTLAMLPQRYIGTALKSLAYFDGQGANGEWVGRARIAACPDCLRANDICWRVDWRLAWSMLCPDHGVYLSTHCPNPECARKLYYPETWFECHPWRRGRYWTWRINPDANPDPPAAGSLEWCFPIQNGPVRFRPSWCLFPADMVLAVEVGDRWLLDFQRILNRHANAVGGAERVRVAAWFSDLKDRVITVLTGSMSEKLDWIDEHGNICVADPMVVATWRRWVLEREAFAHGRPQGRRHWLKRQCASGPYPLLMAAALRLIAAGDRQFRDQVRAAALGC